MIEVELITLGNENAAWLNECKAGLNSPLVNLHQGTGIKGNINASRMAVWDSCGGTLLSSVDPDDVPSVDAWQKLQDAMDQNPTAMGAYTLEAKINAMGSIIGLQPNTSGRDPVMSPLVAHHILVVRRSIYDLVRPFAQQFNVGIEWLLAIAAFHQGGLICVPSVGYKWRRHLNNSGHLQYHTEDMGKKFLAWMWQQSGVIPKPTPKPIVPHIVNSTPTTPVTPPTDPNTADETNTESSG